MAPLQTERLNDIENIRSDSDSPKLIVNMQNLGKE